MLEHSGTMLTKSEGKKIQLLNFIPSQVVFKVKMYQGHFHMCGPKETTFMSLSGEKYSINKKLKVKREKGKAKIQLKIKIRKKEGRKDWG